MSEEDKLPPWFLTLASPVAEVFESGRKTGGLVPLGSEEISSVLKSGVQRDPKSLAIVSTIWSTRRQRLIPSVVWGFLHPWLAALDGPAMKLQNVNPVYWSKKRKGGKYQALRLLLALLDEICSQLDMGAETVSCVLLVWMLASHKATTPRPCKASQKKNVAKNTNQSINVVATRARMC